MKRIIMLVAALTIAATSQAGERTYGERLKYRNAAVKGQVLLGMTPKEVKRAVGKPIRVNRSTSGIDEQWVYDKPSAPRYIYIDEGEVISISD